MSHELPLSYHKRERNQLELLHQLGWFARAIARKLGRHHSSLSRELKRQGTEESYCANRAQTSYITKRARCKPSGKWNAERQRYITMKLAETWSPEQIEGRMNATVEGRHNYIKPYQYLRCFTS
ncbi:helix-turn-helix domain-containing protein [Paenibacillus algorifonticola]|uniref:helix-turn-helix domain-containing protein n=1 Tax=Paenibacillus algorifonticola TaxID=684063 RepID=UPI0009E4011F